MAKYELTEFGKTVKLELILGNKTQQWLIEQMKHKTEIYVDSSNLHNPFLR